MPSPQLFINPGPGVSPSTPLDFCENIAAIGLGNEPDNSGPWTIEFTVVGFKPSLNQIQDAIVSFTDETFSQLNFAELQYQTTSGDTVLGAQLGDGFHQINLGPGYPDGDYTVRVTYDGDHWEAFINGISVGSGDTGGTAPSPFTRMLIDMEDRQGDGVCRITSVYGGRTPP